MAGFSERSEIGVPPNELSRALDQRRRAGAPWVDLTVSNPTVADLPYERDRIREALARAATAPYAPHPLGARRARRWLAEEASAGGVRIGADDVLLTASTSEAYAHLFTLLADPGDEILVPEPSYPLLLHLAHLAGVQLVPYPLRWDGRWSLDSLDLFEAITDRTRALVAVSPNNPTGQYLLREDLEALASLGLPLIVDEVFFRYPLEPAADRVRAATCSDVLTFSLDGLSKSAALPGLKLAWTLVSGPAADVREALERLEHVADAFLSPNAPAQLALPELLGCAETTRRAIRERAARNLEHLRAACAGTAMDVPRVEGGWYAPVRLPATEPDEAWALRLLERGVYVHPGYFYDFPADQAWVVPSLLTPPAHFDAGVDILTGVVRDAAPQ